MPAKTHWSAEIRQEYEDMLQNTTWRNMPFVGSSKYLGFYFGPDTNWDQVYTSIVNKKENRLHTWSNNTLGLFDKIRLWNIFISSLLSYTDQLAMQPDEITEIIQALLKTHICGTPNGWISARQISKIHDLDFPIAPRSPGPSNLASRTRVYLIMLIGMWNDCQGAEYWQGSMAFTWSPLLCLNRVPRHWRHLHHRVTLIREASRVIKADGSAAHERTQEIAYSESLERWKWWSPKESALFNREEITTRLQKDLVRHFGTGGLESGAFARAWINNFKLVSKWVPPQGQCMPLEKWVIRLAYSYSLRRCWPA